MGSIRPAPSPGGAPGSRSLPELPAIPARAGQSPQGGRGRSHRGACASRAARPRYRRRAPPHRDPAKRPLPGVPALRTAAAGRPRARPPRTHLPVAPQRGRASRPSPPAAPAGTNGSGRKQEAPAALRRHFRPAASGSFSNGPTGCPCERRAPPAGGQRRCAGVGGAKDGAGPCAGRAGLVAGRAWLGAGRAWLGEGKGVRAVPGQCVFVTRTFLTSDICSLLHRITGCLVGVMVFSHRLDS